MKTFLETKDFAISGETFRLKHDTQLDMLITEPRPDDMAPYYDSSSYISHTDASKTVMDHLYHLVKRYMLGRKVRLMEGHTRGPGKVLDIGAGTGDFLQRASSRNWSVCGVEPNQKARGLALEKQVRLYPDLQEVHEKDFDAVTLWHSLEHLPNFDTYIDRIKYHLVPNGVILVAVPNYKSLDAKFYKEYWAAYDVPRHLWHFSQASIKSIFRRHDLEVREIIPMRFDAYYIALLSERYLSGRDRYLRAFVNGWRSNLSARRTSEYSSLLYVITRA